MSKISLIKSFLFLFLFLSFIYSEPVSVIQAEKVAKNLLISKNLINHDTFSIESTYTIKEGSLPLIYIFNGGFNSIIKTDKKPK